MDGGNRERLSVSACHLLDVDSRRWMECRAVSLSHLLVHDDSPWAGIPRRGLGSGRGAASSAVNASARVGTERDQPPRPRGPTAGAVNSNPPDRRPATERISSQPLNLCPAAGGLEHSNRRTGPGTESYVKSAWSGPRCLRRATSNPQRQHSLLGTFGRASHPYGQPGQQGIVPPGFLWLEILENPDNTAIITGGRTGKDPLQHPPALFSNC